jgi:hypothetical protein
MIALRGIYWRPSYLIETSDFAPPSRDEFALAVWFAKSGVWTIETEISVEHSSSGGSTAYGCPCFDSRRRG